MKLDQLKIFKQVKEMMSAVKSGLFLFLLTCLLAYAASEEVKAKLEENVLLDCRSPGSKYLKMLRWIRPDLRSDGYVYFFRENRSYEQFQHPSFLSRVKLRDPEMTDGDVSVILKDFNIGDTGMYECYVGNNTGRSPDLINIIHLRVEAVHENITAEPGETINLPCQVPRNTQIAIVKWIRDDLDPEYVFLYKNRQSDPDHQHPSFKDRVDLKDSGIKDGNLSLILKNVMINDTGIYKCHVYQSERNHTMSIVNLDVHQTGGAARDKKEEEPAGNNSGHVGLTVGLPVGLILVAVVAVAGFLIYRKHT